MGRRTIMAAAEQLQEVLEVLDKDFTNLGLMQPMSIRVHLHVNVDKTDDCEAKDIDKPPLHSYNEQRG